MEIIRQAPNFPVLSHSCTKSQNREVAKSMRRVSILLALTLFCAGYALAQEPNNPPPTFTKDVAPILQKHCQTCHRPGEAAPFSLMTYEQARPWAAAMKLAVKQKQMPPWFADPAIGHFANDRSLTEKEISTILA